jgi:hypothetical protein
MNLTNQLTYAEAPSATRRTASRLGAWAAVLTTLCTAVFAVTAIATPARSGPFCATWGCVAYPYTEVAQFIPGDYYWLIPGILLAPLCVVLFACLHASVPEERKLYSRLALLCAGAYAVVIVVDYFSQFTIVMPSLQSGETAGLSLFTQYNPHGFFIAGEALGYLLLSCACLCAAPVFAGGGVERALRWVLALASLLAAAAFVGLWLVKGDLVAFEVTILMIDWLALIVSGALLSILFRRDSSEAAVVNRSIHHDR